MVIGLKKINNLVAVFIFPKRELPSNV